MKNSDESSLFEQRIEGTREKTVLWVDGREVPAFIGEPIAAVMLRMESMPTRSTPVQGKARGPHCMMGTCFDCLAMVDGRPSVRTCQVPVRSGMRVERQDGSAKLQHV